MLGGVLPVFANMGATLSCREWREGRRMIRGCGEGGENVACIIAMSGEAVVPLALHACRRNFAHVIVGAVLMDTLLRPGCSPAVKDPVTLLKA
jgi:hypothetical protein